MLEKNILENNKEINSIDEFIKNQNNFYAYFVDYCEWGLSKRKKDYFKEFQERYPKFEKELTERISNLIKESGVEILYKIKNFPYEDLFKAYSKMVDIIKEKNLNNGDVGFLIK
ncbi:hypothetical protein GYA25_01075 [Candidatus Woesearchaeota archaeon]|jgi:effector-binding domain-containing protein|nr:hypothetical protein [Candidatus Woesearchaeota archaeon]